MLDALVPGAFVLTTIGPDHGALAASLVFYVFTFINITTGPLIITESVFLIVEIGTFVCVAALVFGAAPLSLAVFDTVFEITYVNSSIFPKILTLSTWLTIIIFTSI